MKLGAYQQIFLEGLLERGSWDDENDWFGRRPGLRKPILKALQKKGLITVGWEGDLEVARITQAGKEAINVQANL